MVLEDERPGMFALDIPPASWKRPPGPGVSYRVGDRIQREEEEDREYEQNENDPPDRTYGIQEVGNAPSQPNESGPRPHGVRKFVTKLVELNQFRSKETLSVGTEQDSASLGVLASPATSIEDNGSPVSDFPRDHARAVNDQRARRAAAAAGPLPPKHLNGVSMVLTMESPRLPLRVMNGLPSSVEGDPIEIPVSSTPPERAQNPLQYMHHESWEARNMYPRPQHRSRVPTEKTQKPSRRSQHSRRVQARSQTRVSTPFSHLNKPLPQLPPASWPRASSPPRAGLNNVETKLDGVHREEPHNQIPNGLPDLRIGRRSSPSWSPSRQFQSVEFMQHLEGIVKDRGNDVINDGRDMPSSLAPEAPHSTTNRTADQSRRPLNPQDRAGPGAHAHGHPMRKEM